jgi:hypothetical protein
LVAPLPLARARDVADIGDRHLPAIVLEQSRADLDRDAPAVLGEQRLAVDEDAVALHGHLVAGHLGDVFRSHEVQRRKPAHLLQAVSQQPADGFVGLKEVASCILGYKFVEHDAVAGELKEQFQLPGLDGRVGRSRARHRRPLRDAAAHSFGKGRASSCWPVRFLPILHSITHFAQTP